MLNISTYSSDVTVIQWITSYVINNVMTTRYIAFSVGTSNVMMTSVTSIQIFMEVNKL